MIVENIVGFFQGITNSVPEKYQIVLTLLFYTIFIVIYSIFIWKFYRFMAERDIIKLNLRQYNRSDHPQLGKFNEVLLSILEYIVILPFLVLSWFVVFSIFFLLLSKNQSAEQILLITAAIISSIRLTAYISEDLSKDIAKIFPFTVLVLFLLDPKFFELNVLFDKIIQIPTLFNHILVFIVFIFGVELILRILYSSILFFYSRDDD